MKKLLMPFLLASVLVACGGGETKKEEEKPAESAKVEDITANPDYQKGLALIAQSDCLGCHKVNEAFTGPAYVDVAARYSNAADTTVTRLAGKIISGGSGNWGAIPMSPHPALSQADAEQMVKYVLLLKKP